MSLEHRTAKAADEPCQVYQYHAPIPTRTQFHHSKPVYLQLKLYGEIRYRPDLWCCGTCHDSIHDWISWLLGEARKPEPEPGWKIKRIAQTAVNWYLSEKERIDR